ncbi:MAG: redoxin domain-containing protein [Bacteroidales bacterium]|nr:redoxin domain-containing protein [Bacteroidales bacterium]
MKKLAGKLLLILTFGFFIFLIGGTLIRKANAEEAAAKIRSLPDLIMTDIRGNVFRTDQITSGPLLITFFHPECDHCRYEISSLLETGLHESQLTLLLVSYADRAEIQSFMQLLDIVDVSKLHILHDPDFKMSKLFGADIMPSNFIYNDSLKLVKIFKGSTRPEAMMKYLYGNDKY